MNANGKELDGIKVHQIYSPFQKDSTSIRVLLPDNFSFNENYRVLYVLPVREQGNKKSGDPLVELIKYDLHNKHKLICVFPGYTHLPWYADHSVDKTKQDESHFLKTVIPFVEKNYPTIRKKEGRLLMGFSKSGWGALTLLLRNPETFYKAAGWDIGIRMDTNLADSAYVKAAEYTFGDLENFEKYRVSTLLKKNKDKLGDAPRIFYYNTGGNRARGGAVIHKLMVELEIPHLYIFEPKRKHRWDSGWIPEAVNFLVEDKPAMFVNAAPSKKKPAELVYPLLDAANSRWFYFSSATRPFGMVNLSPDMGVGGAWDSGYRYNQDTINFFSHIHAWQLSGIPVMPTTGEFKGHLGAQKYGSAYSHDKEVVRAGYHSVELESYNIKAELTATTRVGFHRYSYPAIKEKFLLLDLGTMLGPSGTKSGLATQINKMEIAGYALMEKTRRRPKPTYVYYVIKFDTPFEKMQSWQDGTLQGTCKKFEGSNGGVYVNFEGDKAQAVQMKVAISYVSTEQAQLNMQSELPHWDFDKVANEAFEDWNNWLSRIKIEGGTEKQQSRFYTDLWHALQGRRIISDIDGKYCDMTGVESRTGQIPLNENGTPKFNHYNSDAFWGAQWTINTLWHLVYPEVSVGFVNSMLLMYDDGGLIPRGPSDGNYTYVMTGASSTPFIVSAYMKGIRGFDVEKAYEGMRKNAMPGGIMSKAGYEHESNLGGGLKNYIEKGYVPYPNPDRNKGFHNEGAGQTLEYAYQDWCLAQMAKALGKESDYQLFMKRAENYKNIWDKETGWMRPRQLDGDWIEPFNPILNHHGFVESTAAQSTWFVPHDMNGLFNLMGGAEKAALKLNQQFLIADVHDFVARSYKADKFVNSQRKNTFLNYGNQPSMQVGFVFNYAGKPWLTQNWTREVINRIYSDLDPQHGFNGDEDQGLMGALSVLMKMGIFQMKGGADINSTYEIGSPLFDKVTIKLNPDYYKGKEFVIEANNNSDKNRYLQSINLNGEELDKVWFNHDDVIKGGKLLLNMGSKPNKELGKLNRSTTRIGF